MAGDRARARADRGCRTRRDRAREHRGGLLGSSTRRGGATGQRRRDAQARCPRAQIVAADPARDQRAFSPIVSRIEQLAPGVQIIRPGLCALRARGPARYYGGESAAACEILDALAEGDDLPGVRAGVADGPFTAEQAARATGPDAPVRVVPTDETAAFLAPLPVTVLADDELAHLLSRLGVHTLGAFAQLDPTRIRDRFGPRGQRLHALATGADSRPITARTPPPELDREVLFEPPLELAEQVAFGMRVAADEFISGLGAHDLVCTELRVRLVAERGECSERVWLAPGSFDASAVVDRVRWQLAEAAQNRVLRGGVAQVRIEPAAVDAASAHQPAIFGPGAEEKVHHALSRVQAMLGHRGVLTPAIGGGRWLTERQVLVPWGDRAMVGAERSRPWPGSLPPPAPATVFPRPQTVDVTGAEGVCVEVDERGALSAAPAQLVEAGRRRAIVSWAGPWTVDERGWDAARARRAHRFQVVDAEQNAWLLICQDGRWAAEARYD
ncbi:DNA polymerase Y family protein [Microbacterium elymi]|uniref:DNA polymerase Y family protein n=1 Tax=Microbacterium elymi TaxID=2909587 RepID=UPI00338F7279